MTATAPWLALAALMAGGCNAIFGLDAPGGRDGGGDDDVDARSCNSAGHDEDGDGVDDACDLCPHLDSGGVPDQDEDGDGIGDACDPHLGSTDHLIAFYPLEGEDVGLLTLRGSWAYDSSGLRQVDQNFASPTLAVLGQIFDGDLVFDVGFRIDATHSDPQQGFWLWFDALPGPAMYLDGYSLAVRNDAIGDPFIEASSWTDDNQTVFDNLALPVSYEAGQRFRVHAEQRAGTVTAGAIHVESGAGQRVSFLGTDYNAGKLGFTTIATAVTIEYAIAYGTGP